MDYYCVMVKTGSEQDFKDRALLDSSAENLEYESEMAINKMVSLLEPLMIVIMAGIVGFIMISVIMPIYGSYDAIGAGY